MNAKPAAGLAGAAGDDERRAGDARPATQSPSVLIAVVAAILAATAVLRITVGASEPLWLDEAWTGVHALQPTLAQFLRGIYIDINAPLYYVLAWGWAAVFGVSNEALRFPSLVFGLLTPCLALLLSGEIDRPTRLIWCALLATWVPGILQSQEARCYTLLLALATGGTILHARLIAAPSLRRASAWAAIGALAILTHYYAAILFGCQGLAYLACHRARALRTWPAALAFLPAFGWMAYQLPQLATFAATSWFSALSLSSLPWLALYALGPGAIVLLIAAIGAGGSSLGMALLAKNVRRPAVLTWVVSAAVAGTACMVILGFVRPSFTYRYLTVFEPGLLLALAVWASSVARARPWAPAVFLASCLCFALLWSTYLGASSLRLLNFESASDYLMREGADTVAFTWDNPSTQGLSPGMMAELGSFFFRRAGSPIRTAGIVLQPGQDPNRVLLAAARTERAGILWIYDHGVAGTAASTYPPAIAEADPNWSCSDTRQLRIGALACVRSGTTMRPAP